MNTTPESLPVVTILIATFNSEKILPRTLEGIKKQSYPQDKLDLLAVDGGSTDGTYALIERYGGRVIHNPRTEPVHAKLLGMQAARGRYVLTLDHDEVMVNPDSILHKVQALQAHPECKAALCGGYLRPDDYPLLNQYISEFGDPYSLFIYRFSKSYGFFEKNLRDFYDVCWEDETTLCVSFKELRRFPLIELVCAGTMIDKEYFSFCMQDETDLVHAFYIMRAQGDTQLLVIKNDPLLHYSADSLKAYWPKLRYRVWNNVNKAKEDNAGYAGRERFQPGIGKKALLFVPYTGFILPALVDGIGLAISRKNPIYLMHPIFCWYVLLQIVYQYTRKLLKAPTKAKSYDGKKEIS